MTHELGPIHTKYMDKIALSRIQPEKIYTLYSRDTISEPKPRKRSMQISLVEYGDILILIGNFP